MRISSILSKTIIGFLTLSMCLLQPLQAAEPYYRNLTVEGQTSQRHFFGSREGYRRDASPPYRNGEPQVRVDATRGNFLTTMPSGDRFWAPAERPVVRGQYEQQQIKPVSYSLYDKMERHPILTYSILAALIAVPIAVISNNQESDLGG